MYGGEPGSTGFSLQVPQRPRKRLTHCFKISLLLLAGEGMHFAKLWHHPLPWRGAGEGREHRCGYPGALQPALLPAQHTKETRMNLDANPAHRALPLLDKVFFCCAILS